MLKIKLIFVLAFLGLSFAENYSGLLKTPATSVELLPSGLPKPTDLLPNVTNLFKQFADLMKNGFCGIDLENLITKDPDEKRSTCEIVENKGFPCEKHNVTTYGGYIIELHRIPAQGPQAENKTKRPVIIQAGLVGTSADFVIGSASFDQKNTSKMSGNLGLELAKRGYDVWLSNNRGGKYGMAHQTLSPSKDKAFWEWTFEQMSEQDTTAVVDYVLSKTGYDKLHYVGQSQGTALMWALLATNQTINEKLASYVAISPITRLGKANTTGRAFINIFEPLLKIDGPIFTPNKVLDSAVSLACDAFGSRVACKLVLFSLTGPNCDELDESRLGVIMGHMPTSTSTRNLLHYKQLMDTDRFKRYDSNLINTAKDYPLGQISLKSILVIYGPNDWVVPLAGVEKLKTELPGRTFYALSNPQANHIDPLVGKRSAPETNWQVARYIEQKD